MAACPGRIAQQVAVRKFMARVSPVLAPLYVSDATPPPLLHAHQQPTGCAAKRSGISVFVTFYRLIKRPGRTCSSYHVFIC